MAFLKHGWRYRLGSLAAAFALAGLLLGMACKGTVNNSANNNNLTVTGSVSFVRIPELRNASGVPTGLETDPTKYATVPARWVMLRLITAKEETNASGQKVWIWKDPQPFFTDGEGNYSIGVSPDSYGFIELISIGGKSTSSSGTQISQSIRVIAKDGLGKGIESDVAADERLLYALRRPMDGTDPSGTPNPIMPGVTLKADATVNFKVGLNDKWLLTSWPTQALESATLESTGTGSRVMAILDSAYKVASVLDDPGPGNLLFLHYAPGISHSKGSFIEYDPLAFPKAFAATGNRYTFGSIRGDAANDDAWDEGVLVPLFCRNRLWSQRPTGLYPVQARRPEEAGFLTDVQDLTPDLAFVQGMPEAMAANILKSPYLADHAGVTAFTVRDVRDWRHLGSAPFSAPALAALGWELALKANGIASPGTPTQWATIDPKALNRFFLYATPFDTDGATPRDVNNLYTQIPRLQETKTSLDTVDLQAIFTDSVLPGLLSPFGVTWPRPISGPHATFLGNWGTDPLSFTKGFTFSMTNAVTDRNGVYRNVGRTEVAYGYLLLSKDVTYAVSVTPAPPADATLEITLPNREPYVFSPTQSGPFRISIAGNTTTPIYNPFRVRLISPSVKQGEYTFTLRFDKLAAMVSE